MPVYVCILLSLVLLLSSDLQKVENKGRSGTKLSGLRGKNLYLALTGLLLLFIVLSNGAFVGANVLKGMKSIFNTSQEKTSNIATINYIGEIPSDSSVVYWTNRTAEAFIVTRSDIWRFPNYFDKADYLVIQKNVNNSFYEISHEESVTLLEAIGKGSWGSSGDIRSITLKDIEGITRYLVYEKKTHEVVADNKYIIAFEKIKKETFEMPYFTIGVGWARDIPKVLERYKIW
jgi:hypothetical protein